MFELQEAHFVQAPLAAKMLVVAVAAMIHDDATCIAVGVYLAGGSASFGPLSMACLLGTYVGDVGWFVLGRLAGRAALKRSPVNRWVSDDAVSRARSLLEQYGSYAIIVSRFLPGLRTPIQLAAGGLYTSLPRALLHFLIAACLYTPLMIGVGAYLGDAVAAMGLYQRYGRFGLVATALVVWLLLWLTRAAVRRFAKPSRFLTGTDESDSGT